MAFTDQQTMAQLNRLIVPNESGGDYGATNKGSTATGRYQLIKSNWPAGYTQQQLINDPAAQDAAAIKLYNNNYNYLQNKFNRPPTDSEIQAAWHYGAGDVTPGMQGYASPKSAPAGGYPAAGAQTAAVSPAQTGAQANFPASFINGASGGGNASVPNGFAINAARMAQANSPAGFSGQSAGQQPIVNDSAYNAGDGGEDYLMGMFENENNAAEQANEQQEAENGIGAIPVPSIPAIG